MEYYILSVSSLNFLRSMAKVVIDCLVLVVRSALGNVSTKGPFLLFSFRMRMQSGFFGNIELAGWPATQGCTRPDFEVLGVPGSTNWRSYCTETILFYSVSCGTKDEVTVY